MKIIDTNHKLMTVYKIGSKKKKKKNGSGIIGKMDLDRRFALNIVDDL